MTYSRSDVHSLIDNPAWKEILRRIAVIEDEADARMEHADAAINREATGERRVARTIPELPAMLLSDVPQT